MVDIVMEGTDFQQLATSAQAADTYLLTHRNNVPFPELQTLSPSECNVIIIQGSSVEQDICSVEHYAPSLALSPHNWRTHPIDVFTNSLSDKLDITHETAKNVRSFYQRQDRHIRELAYIAELLDENNDGTLEQTKKNIATRNKKINLLIVRGILLANLLLLIGKAVASALSGSLSIISSLLDSCVDLVSGGIMWYTARQMRKRRPYLYPQGRTRFEPISIIVLAVFMASVALQILAESIESIVHMSRGTANAPTIGNTTIILMVTTVVIKLTLWMICRRFGSSYAVVALSVDQRNDTISNSVSLIFSALAGRLPVDGLKFLDPVGAILIGIYILYTWYKLGAEQTRNLAGHTADPTFIQKLVFVCLNHHSAIERLDTVRAFHFGSHFLVEVDIVLPSGMRLKDAHDIGETLQKKLEKLDLVERAFVHLDYEFDHHPDSEHKVV